MSEWVDTGKRKFSELLEPVMNVRLKLENLTKEFNRLLDGRKIFETPTTTEIADFLQNLWFINKKARDLTVDAKNKFEYYSHIYGCEIGANEIVIKIRKCEDVLPHDITTK